MTLDFALQRSGMDARSFFCMIALLLKLTVVFKIKIDCLKNCQFIVKQMQYMFYLYLYFTH